MGIGGGPDRRRSGPRHLGISVFNFNKLSPFRVGSQFDAETHLHQADLDRQHSAIELEHPFVQSSWLGWSALDLPGHRVPHEMWPNPQSLPNRRNRPRRTRSDWRLSPRLCLPPPRATEPIHEFCQAAWKKFYFRGLSLDGWCRLPTSGWQITTGGQPMTMPPTRRKGPAKNCYIGTFSYA
jgi:hypothetical protein